MPQIGTYDGQSNETFSFADLSGNFIEFDGGLLPSDFVSWVQTGGNVVATTRFGTTITITGTTLAALTDANFTWDDNPGFLDDFSSPYTPSPGGALIGGDFGDALTFTGGSGFAQGGGFGDTISLTGTTFYAQGNTGNDIISTTGAGISGSSTLRGGADNDTFTVAFTGGASQVSGDLGDDTISVSAIGAATSVTVNGLNESGTQGQVDGSDAIAISGDGIVLVNANGGQDTIDATGFTGSGEIRGGAQADLISANVAVGKSVVLRGDLGVDTIAAIVDGTAQIFGGNRDQGAADGGDVIVVAGGDGDAIINGQLGDDSVDIQNGFTGDGIFRGGADDDLISVDGAGGAAAAVDQDFLIQGDLGNDSVVVDAGTGDEVDVTTALGDDSIDVTVTGTADADIDAGAGNDTVVVSGAGTQSIDVTAGDGNDSVDLGGLTAASSNVQAGDGDDTVAGGQLADSITGGAGNDLLTGGAGNDTLSGGQGIDILGGGGGTDQLFGGASTDEFHFNTTASADFVRDFVTTEDVISFLDGTGTVEFVNSGNSATRGASDLNANDYVAAADAAAYTAINRATDFVATIGTAVATTAAIDALSSSGTADAYFLVFNDETDRGEIWYDLGGVTDATQIATLENITTFAQFSQIGLDNLDVYS